MLLNRIYIIILLLPLTLWGSDVTTFIFHFQHKKIEVIKKSSEHLTIEKNCFYEQDSCLAYLALKTVSYKKSAKDIKDGATPGAVICKKQLKMKLFVLKDKDGREHTFCKFKDDSFIGAGTLSFYANENDRKTKFTAIKL